MKLIYQHDNAAMVGYAKSLLENNNIAVVEKNEHSATGMGPGYGVTAELWLLNENDFAKARSLLDQLVVEE